jgi:hypothetical protein
MQPADVKKNYSRIRALLNGANLVLIKDSVTIDTVGDRDRAETLYKLLAEVMSEKEGLN